MPIDPNPLRICDALNALMEACGERDIRFIPSSDGKNPVLYARWYAPDPLSRDKAIKAVINPDLPVVVGVTETAAYALRQLHRTLGAK